MAEFNCTGVASSFIWKANGTVLTSNELEIFVSQLIAVEQDFRISTLKIKVSSVENATKITCSAVSLDPFTTDESEPALLLVQGI